MSSRAKYGSVKIVDRNGKLYLDFRYCGERYRPGLNLVSNAQNEIVAKRIASEIELDIALLQFDTTLIKYLGVKNPAKPETTQKGYSLMGSYSLYLQAKDLKGNDYLMVERFLKRSRVEWPSLIRCIEAQCWSVTTYNRYCKILSAFNSWAVSRLNAPEVYLPLKKGTKVKPPSRRPFTDDEIKAIIQAIETNQFCSSKSAFKHDHYSDYVRFMFLTGCRMGEIAGLKVKHFDTVNHTVEIGESLSPVSALDNRRVQKSTKTGSVRVLPLPDSLIKRLIKRLEGKEKNAYVFTGHKGQPIDTSNFRVRVWQPVLEGLGIEYRVPYAARHTMASRAIEQGIPITGVAYLMGHSDTTMVMKQYGHMINKPELPAIDLGA
jgi:integrase